MTVIPIARSVYASGAALGAVFVLIWMAPASNILALVYTNTVLGPAMVIARLISALLSSFVIGITMYYIFRKEEEIKTHSASQKKKKMFSRTGLILILLLIAWLLIPNYVSTTYYWQKLTVWGVGLLIVAGCVTKLASKNELKAWLQQTLSFFKSITPLLMVGIFIIGIIGALLPAELVSRWLGGNGFSQSLISSRVLKKPM